MPIPINPVIAPASLDAAALMASAWAPTIAAAPIDGSRITAERCNCLIISASSSGNVTLPRAILTTFNPLSSPHLAERAVFIASSNSVLWVTIWFGLSSKSDNFPNAGCNALINSLLSCPSNSSRLYSLLTFPHTFV